MPLKINHRPNSAPRPRTNPNIDLQQANRIIPRLRIIKQHRRNTTTLPPHDHIQPRHILNQPARLQRQQMPLRTQRTLMRRIRRSRRNRPIQLNHRTIRQTNRIIRQRLQLSIRLRRKRMPLQPLQHRNLRRSTRRNNNGNNTRNNNRQQTHQKPPGRRNRHHNATQPSGQVQQTHSPHSDESNEEKSP